MTSTRGKLATTNWGSFWPDVRVDAENSSDFLYQINRPLLVEALAAIVVAERVSPKVTGEALRHLGRFAHAPSQKDRLWLLERGLSSTSPLSRDGAGLGLAHLSDPAAIPYLQAAIEREPVRSLKDDLQQVLDVLQHAAPDQAG